MFLLYSPLNQGLKHDYQAILQYPGGKFLLYSPLNQGLKPSGATLEIRPTIGFLLYSPLNQGLKLLHSSSISQNGKSFYSTVH